MSGGRLGDALEALDRGGLVVFPTETVYGIGCRLDRPEAIARMRTVKGREPDKPFQVLLADPSAAAEIAAVDAAAERLLRRFAPGPLTVVLPALAHLPDLGARATVGAPATVGVRVPDHPVALDLLRASGPLAASSANRAGRPTPSWVGAVRAVFADEVAVYLDGPPAPGTVASTVVDLTGEHPVVLREGAVTRADIEAALAVR